MNRDSRRSACVPDEISGIRAQLHLKRSADGETLAKIERLASEFPDSPDVWVLRGEAMELRGDVAEARRSYERALALQPDHAEAERRMKGVS
ncbi:MAG: tetratricopeptide repeat protein [Thermoanaerobaculia bacterium]